jgi:hypothetical protein
MSVERNIAADRWSDRHVFGLTFISSLKSWLVQQPGGDVMARMYRFFKRILQGNNKVW